jgi:hypothetical protein
VTVQYLEGSEKKNKTVELQISLDVKAISVKQDNIDQRRQVVMPDTFRRMPMYSQDFQASVPNF